MSHGGKKQLLALSPCAALTGSLPKADGLELFSEVSAGSALGWRLFPLQSSHFNLALWDFFGCSERQKPLLEVLGLSALTESSGISSITRNGSVCARSLRVGEGRVGIEPNTVCVLLMPPWDAHRDPDSLTGEDSLLDCSLLSNPAADLLDEFAPVAFTTQPHKGKLCSQPWPSCPWFTETDALTSSGVLSSPGHCFVFFPSCSNLECALK